MTTAVIDFADVAKQWRTARRIYPIYLLLLRKFKPDAGPCRELESPIDRAEPEALEKVNKWFALVDTAVEVQHLRQMLQTAHIVTEENLRDLLIHQLSRPVKSASVRDKIDFLCVQYYVHSAHHLHREHAHSFREVAELLRPIIGDHWKSLEPPAEWQDTENLLREAEQCAGLDEVIKRKIVERGRELKLKAGDAYFSAPYLVIFARFNHLLRGAFFRVIQADLQSIRLGLHELEMRGWKDLDCTAAGFSSAEPLEALRRVVHDWKTPFRAAYAPAHNFNQILKVLDAVKKGLASPPPKPVQVAAVAAPPARAVAAVPLTTKPEPAKAMAAAVGAQARTSANLVGPQVVEAPPTPKKVAAPAVGEPRLALTRLDDCLEQIAEKLMSASGKNASMSLMSLGSTKLALASWEVAAFVRGGDETSDVLQRAVAARAMLQIALGEKKANPSIDLTELINSAHIEAAVMQEKVAQAKEAKNIDGAVNLAATAKRLLSTIDQLGNF